MDWSKKISRSSIALSLLGIALPTQAALTHLNIEELMNIEVTSVTKKTESANEASAAIHVITAEDIKHSGVRTIPEALRLAPGVTVGRIGSNKWAVGVRGDLSRFANRLLVLIDGRSIYSQSFSGVYWENHHVVLDDIEQIEVIRGPGATVWGANAMNGVINIITKDSKNTQGVLVNAGTGNIEKGFIDARYGGSLSDNLTYRLYGKTFETDEFTLQSTKTAHDNWRMRQTGMRMDWTGVSKQLTVQSDYYTGDIYTLETFPWYSSPHYIQRIDKVEPEGWNINTRWAQEVSDVFDYMVQAYYDVAKRSDILSDQDIATFDIDSVFNYRWSDMHRFTFGFGFRHYDVEINETEFFSINRPERDVPLYSAFIQDEITVTPKLRVTLGTKIEHNDYTSTEIQPNARFTYIRDNGHVFWGAVSRAVRTPSRAESDATFIIRSQPAPPFNAAIVNLTGSPSFDAEELTAYEMGYRFKVSDELSVDVSGFLNDYHKLRTAEPKPMIIAFPLVIVPVVFENKLYGQTYGVEGFARYNPTDWLDMKLTYSRLHQDYKIKPGSRYTGHLLLENDTPKNNVSLLTKMYITPNFDFDIWLRYMDDIGSSGLISPFTQPIDDYVTLDLQATYRPTEHLELSLVGQNIIGKNRIEAIQSFGTQPTRIPRSVYAKVSINY